MSKLMVAVPIVFLFLDNGALAGSASPSSGIEVLLGASVGDNSEVMYQLFVKAGPGKAMDLTCPVPNGMELVSGEKGKVTGNRVAWKVLKGKKVAGPFTFKARPAGVLKAGDQFRTVAEVRWGKGFNQRAFSNESVLAGVGDPAGLAVVGTNREAVASTAIVASAHPLVSQAGIEVLKKGGNAVDAAAAASFMLGVVNPMHSGLGGYGGFMVVYLAKTKEVWVVDFNTIVPSKASVNMYEILPSQSGWWVVKDNANFTGYKAISVPGMLSGMATALQRFGTKSLKEVMAPAIDVADKGFKINSLIAQATGTSNLPKFPASAAIYLKDGKPMQAGNLLVQKDLADTMRGPEAIPAVRCAVEASITRTAGFSISVTASRAASSGRQRMTRSASFSAFARASASLRSASASCSSERSLRPASRSRISRPVVPAAPSMKILALTSSTAC